MNRVSRIVSVLLLLCFVSIWAMPVKNASAKDKKSVSAKPKEQTQLHEQEKELENLAKLQKDKAGNVLFQTTKDIKVVQENGKKEKVVKTSKNVVNADNGDVLASVRKTLKSENKANGIPKVSAITKVDVPSEDIHETFTDDDSSREEEDEDEGSESGVMASKKNMPSIVSSEESDESSLDEDIKDLQKSSKVMATYLLETGNFERFEDALRDIVKVGLMTVSEANEYERIVLDEYERLMAIEKAEELQAKAAQSPLDYAERDYDLPYPVNNDMDSDEEDEEARNVKRYLERRRSMQPLPARPDYADYADPIQGYNGYEDVQSPEAQDSNEWLNQLLEQVNGAEYPEARQSYSDHSRDNSPDEQERIRRVMQNIFDSEPLSRGYEPHDSSEEEESDEEMMEPLSEENSHSQSEETVSALKALAKMETPAAKRVEVKAETKHQAKKQDVTATDKKKKKST